MWRPKTVTPIPVDLTPSSGFHRYQAWTHVMNLHICRPNIHTHKIKLSEPWKANLLQDQEFIARSGMAFVGTEWHGSCLWDRPADMGLYKYQVSMVAMGMRLVCITLYIFYTLLLRNVNPSDSVITRQHKSRRQKCDWCLSKMINSEIFKRIQGQADSWIQGQPGTQEG